ncbi:hypothetical protein T265_12206 [Opisthorchis viverrini]|uniref:Uncharacterized protein n=1 Tax=Opisthorchis viverrini TaxID=6198 RepID=A0A074YV80_OPIVI|nr:hypothetical protein T265_12206 [Opisthorchis viverrini]KER18646.1 hypothetical protein T265_12206 [Opisthorchis viverrini]
MSFPHFFPHPRLPSGRRSSMFARLRLRQPTSKLGSSAIIVSYHAILPLHICSMPSPASG